MLRFFVLSFGLLLKCIPCRGDVSALTGIALREKWINSLAQPVKSFFPHYFGSPGDDGKNSITLRHLLTMSTGLKIEEQTQDTASIFSRPEQAWMDIRFNGDELTIAVEVEGTDIKFPIHGKTGPPVK